MGFSCWPERRAVVVVRRGGPRGLGRVGYHVERMVFGYEPSCVGYRREQVEGQFQPAPLPVNLVVNRRVPIYLGRGVGQGSRTLLMEVMNLPGNG